MSVVILEACVHGYSQVQPEEILRRAILGTPPSEFPGDFVVTGRCLVHGHPAEAIITSAVSARPYFVLLESTETALHGADFFDLVRRSGLPWRWNDRALRCLALLGHTVGSDTLHPHISRVPCSSTLLFQHGRWTIKSHDFWKRIFKNPTVPPAEVLKTFLSVTGELTGGVPLLSLSGGFDSRCLLAALLHLRVKPILLTMGTPASTDRIVAEAIAHAEKLRIETVQLEPPDYIKHGTLIARLTGGTKTASNWHTYLYARRARDHVEGNHFVGANGEFARTYYFDCGVPARLFNFNPPQAVRLYFAARLIRRRKKFPPGLNFLDGMKTKDIFDLAAFLYDLVKGEGGPLEILDRFYTTQRVRHFIGNGLACYAASSLPVSPFLDTRLISRVACLPRLWKLGAALHRFIISRAAPQLMQFPLRGEQPLAPFPQAGYWLRRFQEVGYSVFNQVLEHPDVSEILMDSPHLETFASRKVREQLVRSRHAAAMDLLMTLHFAGEARLRGGGEVDPIVKTKNPSS